MDSACTEKEVIRPQTTRRRCGDWLAVSPPKARFLIGVCADTEAEALERFNQSFSRWAELLESSELGHSASN